MKTVMNLGLIEEDGKLLLGMKKRRFGAGLWNGFGGKVHPGENIEEALKREFEEECGVYILKMEKRGVIEFEETSKPNTMEVHFYKITQYLGQPKESEEMSPKWFSINELPYENMHPDDRIWMPMFLKGVKFRGKITSNAEKKIEKSDVTEVETL